jgi:hypothetical protein
VLFRKTLQGDRVEQELPKVTVEPLTVGLKSSNWEAVLAPPPPPPPPDEMAAVLIAVISPFELTVMMGTALMPPNVPGVAFTVARVVVVDPEAVETSPDRAGIRAGGKTPVVISDASMLLFVSVCVSVVPTIGPLGAATAVVVSRAVRTITPFAPGSARAAAVACTIHVLLAMQAYKFLPTAPARFRYISPVLQVAGSDVPVFSGRV